MLKYQDIGYSHCDMKSPSCRRAASKYDRPRRNPCPDDIRDSIEALIFVWFLLGSSVFDCRVNSRTVGCKRTSFNWRIVKMYPWKVNPYIMSLGVILFFHIVQIIETRFWSPQSGLCFSGNCHSGNFFLYAHSLPLKTLIHIHIKWQLDINLPWGKVSLITQYFNNLLKTLLLKYIA